MSTWSMDDPLGGMSHGIVVIHTYSTREGTPFVFTLPLKCLYPLPTVWSKNSLICSSCVEGVFQHKNILRYKNHISIRKDVPIFELRESTPAPPTQLKIKLLLHQAEEGEERLF